MYNSLFLQYFWCYSESYHLLIIIILLIICFVSLVLLLVISILQFHFDVSNHGFGFVSFPWNCFYITRLLIFYIIYQFYFAWRILWTEEPGGLQSMGSQRVRQDWAADNFTSLSKDSWEPLGLQWDQTSPSQRKSTLNIHWKDWCWSSNTLATWYWRLTGKDHNARKDSH